MRLRTKTLRGDLFATPALLLCLSLLQPLGAQSRWMQIEGENTWQAGGAFAMTSVSDLDGDGLPEIAISYVRTNTSVGLYTGRVVLHSGADGRLIREWIGQPDTGFGSALADVGDVDRDGYSDIAVGTVADSRGAPRGGSVTVYSGKTGKILHDWVCSTTNGSMGHDVSWVGDLDQDGHHDVLVGYENGTIYFPYPSGEARVLSGKDGSVIHQIIGPVASRLGREVAPAGDVDQDGVPDFYVSNAQSYVVVYSGKTGQSILRHLPPPGVTFGMTEITNVGDVDRDGVPDLGWSAGGNGIGGVNSGILVVLSNKTGAVIHKFWGQPADYMGAALGLGDLDADGHADFAAGAGQAYVGSPNTGYVQAWSGRTGKPMFRVTGTGANETFGWRLAGIGDLTGDGVPEFLVGSNPQHANGLWGRVTVFSPVDVPLIAEPYKLSLKSAGSQLIRVDAGSPMAAQNYWLFGSLTGIRPGVPLGGFTVPLNYDFYTAFTIGNPNNALLMNSRGKLDAWGRATAMFSVPAGLPMLPDFTLHHAAVVFDDAARILDVTNAVSLRLEN